MDVGYSSAITLRFFGRWCGPPPTGLVRCVAPPCLARAFSPAASTPDSAGARAPRREHLDPGVEADRQQRGCGAQSDAGAMEGPVPIFVATAGASNGDGTIICPCLGVACGVDVPFLLLAGCALPAVLGVVGLANTPYDTRLLGEWTAFTSGCTISSAFLVVSAFRSSTRGHADPGNRYMEAHRRRVEVRSVAHPGPRRRGGPASRPPRGGRPWPQDAVSSSPARARAVPRAVRAHEDRGVSRASRPLRAQPGPPAVWRVGRVPRLEDLCHHLLGALDRRECRATRARARATKPTRGSSAPHGRAAPAHGAPQGLNCRDSRSPSDQEESLERACVFVARVMWLLQHVAESRARADRVAMWDALSGIAEVALTDGCDRGGHEG